MMNSNSTINNDAVCFHIKTNPFAPSGRSNHERITYHINGTVSKNVATNAAMQMYKQLI